MKILKIAFCLFLACGSVFGASDKLSKISIPETTFLNIDADECGKVCLDTLLKNEKLFSFLAKYKDAYATKYTQENYLIYGQMFNLFLNVGTHTIKIAVLVPQKTIKNYALMSVNAAISYLLRQSNDFELSVFNSIDEEPNSLRNAISDIRRSGYSYVIAPITQDGAQTLFKNSNGLFVFIPTLHKSFFADAPLNIIFGGIDYNAQIEALDDFSNKLAVTFSDESKLGLTLNQMISTSGKIILQETIFSSTKVNLKKYFENNKNLNGSSVYLNTTPIATSLLSSQIRVYKYAPFSLLSTQINFQPSLLMFTQYEDRQNMYLANSIGKIDAELNSVNAFLGNNLEYEYVNYAVSIGVEYFSKRFFNTNTDLLFGEKVNEDAQVEYQTKVYQAGRYGFVLPTKTLDPNRPTSRENYDFMD
jgi:hypothetical protein